MSVTTDLGFSYELDIDINTAGPGAVTPSWQQIRFTSAIAPSIDPTMLDAATYDDEGAANQERVGESWSVPLTVQQRRLIADGSVLPEMQVLLDAAKPGKRGNAALVEVRFYDSAGSDYAFQGTAVVKVDRGATGNAEIGSWSVTLTGKGKLVPIANPSLDDTTP